MEQTRKKSATETARKEGLNARMIEARESSVKAFGDIEHRLEHVDLINGVEWINDSKSTDPGSTLYSLDFMTKPVVWIVGSNGLEDDYSLFAEIISEKVQAIVGYGVLNPEIESLAAMNGLECSWWNTVEETVAWCSKNVTSGSVVLFSPSCSSFERFTDFKQRGEAFRVAVNQLKSL